MSVQIALSKFRTPYILRSVKHFCCSIDIRKVSAIQQMMVWEGTHSYSLQQGIEMTSMKTPARRQMIAFCIVYKKFKLVQKDSIDSLT